MAIRNPIQYHGEYDKGKKLYIQMPMAMHLDKSVTPDAYRVFGAIFSNVEGWEVSVTWLMDKCGMTKRAVQKAIGILIDARWIARQALGNNRYILHVARIKPFPESDHTKLNTYSPAVQKRSKPVSSPQITCMACGDHAEHLVDGVACQDCLQEVA
ncbi:hypothetical protein [Rhodococcus koreensis]